MLNLKVKRRINGICNISSCSTFCIMGIPIMSKTEMLKWIGTLFIILSPITAFYHFIPLNFLILCIGTGIWCIAGMITKDRPMIFVNIVSTVLNIFAYLNN